MLLYILQIINKQPSTVDGQRSILLLNLSASITPQKCKYAYLLAVYP